MNADDHIDFTRNPFSQKWQFPILDDDLNIIKWLLLDSPFLAVVYSLKLYNRLTRDQLQDYLSLDRVVLDRVLLMLAERGRVRKKRRIKGFHIVEYWEAK